ncbi:heterokaryon incompatibility protein-domain-containing protein [Cubamyces lactineus]|nr:heterokaryon incompatibility protein-domain-containing protein [Cubamyces lactineus]
MRLLNTRTGRFVENVDPERACYATLSHVWDNAKGEQSYQQVLAIWQNAERSHLASFDARGEAPCENAISILDRPELSPKIKGFCAIARDHGYTLGWIDSCCIDKTSSAELTEAINSMYQWYRKADICYAYLADVHDDVDTSPYRPSERLLQKVLSSRWHTRGWTLQELIAPENVLFLTRTWRVIDSKLGLATLLEHATGVSAAVLTGEAAVESVSVACRMSWASSRKTTRIEDEAYSLLGIFGVYMPTIYGEGRNAFLRLQQEIIKTIPDQSIFAWGVVPSYSGVESGGVREWLKSIRPNRWLREPGGLLAASPAAFEFASNVAPVSGAEFASAIGYLLPSAGLPDLRCTFTPEGAHVRLLWYSSPLLDPPIHMPPPADGSPSKALPAPCSCDRKTAASIVALLRCRNRAGQILALILTAASDALHSAWRSDEYHRVRLTVCGAHHPSRRVITLPCQWKEWMKAPDLYEVLKDPSDVPLVIHPVLDSSLTPSKDAAAFKQPPLFAQLSPWCREKLSVLGVEVSPIEPVFRLWPGAHHHLLLEHRCKGVVSDVARPHTHWVLTSRIHIIVFHLCEVGGRMYFHVRHQAILESAALDPDSRPFVEKLSDLEHAIIGDSALPDSIWQAIDSLSQGPPPRFEYELPSCTGFPSRRLRLSVRELQEELPVRSGRPETGRSAWLTVQFSGSEAVETLPTSQDGRRWKTLVLAE